MLHSQIAEFSGGERFVQASGFAVFVCLIAAGAVSPDPPSHGAPDAAAVVFYQQHAGGVLAGAFLWGLGMMALLLFAGALSRACHAPHVRSRWLEASLGPAPALLPAELLKLFSGVAATMFLLSQAVEGAAAVTALRAAPGPVVRALDEVSHLTAHLGTLPLGSFVLAAGLAQLAARCGARWIAWLGIVAGSGLVITTSWVAIGHQRLHDAGVVCLLLFLVWSAASSVSLLRFRRAVVVD
jgi:hypothetical protein